jgi:cysteinylglycine-S-conjugate dipeptidase
VGPPRRHRARDRLPSCGGIISCDPAPGAGPDQPAGATGHGCPKAQTALVDHLKAVAPWQVRVTIEREADGQPFTGSLDGPGYDAMSAAMKAAYGKEVTQEGQGGSIPLCNVFKDTFPDAEILLLGVEEPLCLIHAPNESVAPSEIENMALVEALFLQNYAAMRGNAP